MKKILVIFMIMVIFTGCSKASSEPTIKSIEDVNVNELVDFAGTYVGNNSEVLAILQNLAGGETIKELELTDEKIKVTYGFEGNGLTENEINNYWFNGTSVARENFYFNAIYLAILVPNAKEYHFQVNNSIFSISRERMVQILSEKLTDFPQDEAIWSQDEVKKLIDTNHEEIEKMASNYKEF